MAGGLASCPGRSAASFTLLRRAGTYDHAVLANVGPGSAAHRSHAAQHPGHISSALALAARLGRRGRRPTFGTDDTHGIAVDDAVGRRADHAVVLRNPPGELDVAPKVARDRHRLEQD